MEVRLISSSLQIDFEHITNDCTKYDSEFERLSEIERDPIGQWYKKQKAKGDIDKQSEALVTLLVELHRKVDELSKTVTGESVKPIELENSAMIDGIGYEYFNIAEISLKEGLYYGRICLPVFPERTIPVYFSISENGAIAKITKMHQQDHTDWDSFVIAKERQHIQDARDIQSRNELWYNL